MCWGDFCGGIGEDIRLWAVKVVGLLALTAAFVVFSLVTLWQDGLLQFWLNHTSNTSNFSGNQVWFDLLLSVTVAFYLIAPRARAVGMRMVPWGVAVLASASIALLPMVARLIWLERRGV